MNRDADPFEIAQMVARAERVKRNREIVLRTVKAPAAAPTDGRRPPFPPALHVEIRLRPMTAVQGSDGAEPLD
jgi:hypothetical protein